MSNAKHHAEWLSLLEVSGPFLSMPVLLQIFPQGLDAHDPEHFRTLRAAFDEWEEGTQGKRPDSAIHRLWVEYILKQTLGFIPEVLLEGQQIPSDLSTTVAEHGEIIKPDWVLINPQNKTDEGKPRLLVQMFPLSQNLNKPLEGSRWKASPAIRMMELLHATNVRLGLLTNGSQWMLVNAPRGETTGFISWYANLWLDEKVTLQAFRTLLSLPRFFGVQESETLESLLAQSSNDQQEVTDQLGYQVRKAVEVLVHEFDRVDKDRNRELLDDVSVEEMYEAALTVMMRLVFLFSAEERNLLLLGDELYDLNYAVSTLRAQLREQADEYGEEVLARRSDAWCRLLATFRVIYGGVEHESMRLPAYGGNLFNPDRFPFLEGRKRLSVWVDSPADPLPINNQIVLHLLEALQILQVKVPGGGIEPRRLSFRALDIEQIGHVYEGLLDHTAVKATSPVLGLLGSKDKEPEIELEVLEVEYQKGEESFLTFLKDKTGRSVAALKKGLDLANVAPLLQDQTETSRLKIACDNDEQLFERVKLFAGLLRKDTVDFPVVINAGSVYVTQGSERRTTGTHYTPRSLTEEIVKYTLEPLVYEGVAEGKSREEWRLRSAAELLELKICDIACGSGAFLVQVCRYLSERLVEAWEDSELQHPGMVIITPEGGLSEATPDERPIPADADERLTIARRIIADRCLYGVDRNSMAVEMAKLSLWLTTLQKNRPFSFLDHAIRCGDSLLGVTSVEQLESFELDPSSGQQIRLISGICKPFLEEAAAARRELESFEANTVEDIELKEIYFRQAEKATNKVRFIADILIGLALTGASRRKRKWNVTREAAEEDQDREIERLENEHEHWESLIVEAVRNWQSTDLENNVSSEKLRDNPFYVDQIVDLRDRAKQMLGNQNPFHWVLEFPEIFAGENNSRKGFDAFVGNPPFIGGQKITGALGTSYRDYLVEYLANGKRGSADLVAYFFLRVKSLLKSDGTFGLVATNTIAQGTTREIGLDQITAGSATIYRAISSRKWQGAATVVVSFIWLMNNSKWQGKYILNEKEVKAITPFLTAQSSTLGNPRQLKKNQEKSFQGSIVLGMGFILTPDEASALIIKSKHNSEVLFPYLMGEDLNTSPDQSPSRWVINFFNYPLERINDKEWGLLTKNEQELQVKIGRVAPNYSEPVARDFPDCIKILEERVKSERIKNSDKGASQFWWRFLRLRGELWLAIDGMSRILCKTRHSPNCAFEFVTSGNVFQESIVIFAFDADEEFAILSSTIHEVWAWEYGSTLGQSTLRYSPSDCFETFPFPDLTNELEGIGAQYHEFRREIMLNRQEGLTQTYNRFHNRQKSAPDIVRLRQLHAAMDEAVKQAYGWHDLRLEHDFHETKQGIRFTISPEARQEVLDRLLQLNFDRYAEEVANGLHDKGKKNNKKSKKIKAAATQTEYSLPF